MFDNHDDAYARLLEMEYGGAQWAESLRGKFASKESGSLIPDGKQRLSPCRAVLTSLLSWPNSTHMWTGKCMEEYSHSSATEKQQKGSAKSWIATRTKCLQKHFLNECALYPPVFGHGDIRRSWTNDLENDQENGWKLFLKKRFWKFDTSPPSCIVLDIFAGRRVSLWR